MQDEFTNEKFTANNVKSFPAGFYKDQTGELKYQGVSSDTAYNDHNELRI